MQPPPANVRLTTFLQALRADLQRPVRTQEPQTLEAALHEARKAERIADSLYSGGRREQPFRRDDASAMTGNVPERGLLGPDGTPWRTRNGRDTADASEGSRYQAGREAAGGQTRGTFAATMRTQPTDGRGRGDTMGGATRGREAQRTIGTQAQTRSTAGPVTQGTVDALAAELANMKLCLANNATQPARGPMRCYTCNKEGHMTRQCPENSPNRPAGSASAGGKQARSTSRWKWIQEIEELFIISETDSELAEELRALTTASNGRPLPGQPRGTINIFADMDRTEFLRRQRLNERPDPGAIYPPGHVPTRLLGPGAHTGDYSNDATTWPACLFVASAPEAPGAAAASRLEAERIALGADRQTRASLARNPAPATTTEHESQLGRPGRPARRVALAAPRTAVQQAVQAALEQEATRPTRGVSTRVTPKEFSLTQRLESINAGISLAQLLYFCPFLRNQLSEYLQHASPRESTVMAMNGRANEAYTIPVLVKGRRIVALVDSGASVNVVGAQLATELSLRVCTKERPTTLYLGDGTPIQAAKEVKGLVLAVEDLLIPIDALVLDDVGYEMLLGRAFMTATEMTLNCKEETYTIEWQGDKRVIRASRGYKVKWEEENRRLQHERPRFTEVFRIDSPQPTQAELDEEDREKEAIRKREESKDAAEEQRRIRNIKGTTFCVPTFIG